jgi:hypothetical protein
VIEVGEGSGVILGSQFRLSDVGTIRRAEGGGVSLVGVLENDLGVFDLGETTGTLVMAGGVIRGGRLEASKGARLRVIGNVSSGLDGVTLATDPSFEGTSGRTTLGIGNVVTLENVLIDLSVGGTVEGNGLGYDGRATLAGTGEVRLGRHGVMRTHLTGSTLEIGPGILIRGAGEISGTVTNRGRIETDVAGRNLWLTGVSNAGAMRVSGGGTLRVTGAWVNSGRIEVEDGTLSLEGVWSNPGMIRLGEGATLNLHSDTWGGGRIAGLGGITGTAGASVNLYGTLDNAGRTLDAAATGGTFTIKGGTIIGGRIQASGNSRLTFEDPGSAPAGYLVGVTLAADLVANSAGAKLHVNDGLTLDGAVLDLGGGTNRFAGNLLSLNGPPQALRGTGKLLLGGAGDARVLTEGLTIEPGIEVAGSGVLGGDRHTGTGEDRVRPITNHGTIRADVPGATLRVFRVTNSGTMHVAAGATLRVDEQLSNGGRMVIDAGGEAAFASTAPLTQGAGGSLLVNGLLDVTSGINQPSAKLDGVVSGTGVIRAWTIVPANTSIAIDGTVSPGSAEGGLDSLGTLTLTGSVAMGEGSRLLVEVGGAGRSDVMAVNGGMGNLSIGPGAFLEIVEADQIGPGLSYVVATYTGRLRGSFEGWTPGFEVSYATPQSIVVTKVPEPGVGLIGGVGGALVLMRGRARRAERRSMGRTGG